MQDFANSMHCIYISINNMSTIDMVWAQNILKYRILNFLNVTKGLESHASYYVLQHVVNIMKWHFKIVNGMLFEVRL